MTVREPQFFEIRESREQPLAFTEEGYEVAKKLFQAPVGFPDVYRNHAADCPVLRADAFLAFQRAWSELMDNQDVPDYWHCV